MKPEWRDAPEWAMWLAMDERGKWCWFRGEPYKSLTVWMPTIVSGDGDTFDECVGIFSADFDWQNTLEPRP